MERHWTTFIQMFTPLRTVSFASHHGQTHRQTETPFISINYDCSSFCEVSLGNMIIHCPIIKEIMSIEYIRLVAVTADSLSILYPDKLNKFIAYIYITVFRDGVGNMMHVAIRSFVKNRSSASIRCTITNTAFSEIKSWKWIGFGLQSLLIFQCLVLFTFTRFTRIDVKRNISWITSCSLDWNIRIEELAGRFITVCSFNITYNLRNLRYRMKEPLSRSTDSSFKPHSKRIRLPPSSRRKKRKNS